MSKKNQPTGTHITVPFTRVVDGDTLRVKLPGEEKDSSLRLLCLDCEESYSGGRKPKTPWGKAAKAHAEEFFAEAREVTIEFPGKEPLEECMSKYRGNYGRLLVYVWYNNINFQEHMIREGYSPYFNKYGNAANSRYHHRLQHAERQAQADNLGVWDQFAVNGAIRRNYAVLGTWWQLRAHCIDDFREAQIDNPALLNTRLDYARIVSAAEKKESRTIFTELHSIKRTGRRGAILNIGSNHQPFTLYLSDVDSVTGQNTVHLLLSRYITENDDNPRRSYAYVTGQLHVYNGLPQMILESPWQITDIPPEQPIPHIHSALPNPKGKDYGNETITPQNPSCGAISLEKWTIRDRSGKTEVLSGTLPANSTHAFTLKKVRLNNGGDSLELIDPRGRVRHKVEYTKKEVIEDKSIHFPAPEES